MKQQGLHQDNLTSHTLSSKMKNFVPQKNRIKDEHKKRHISETQIPKLKT